MPLTIDLTELELPDTMKTEFPDPNDVLNFKLTITPDEGEFILSTEFPHLSPQSSSEMRC